MNVNEAVVDGGAALAQVMPEEAVGGAVQGLRPTVTITLRDGHHAHKAFFHPGKVRPTAEKMDVGIDLVDGIAEVNVDILGGMAVGDVSGENHAHITKIAVPAYAVGIALKIREAGMKVHIHAALIVPVHKKAQGLDLGWDAVGDAAADVAALGGLVAAVKPGGGEVVGIHAQHELFAAKAGIAAFHAQGQQGLKDIIKLMGICPLLGAELAEVI